MENQEIKKSTTANKASTKKSELKVAKKEAKPKATKKEAKVISEVKASLRFAKIAPRKTRLVINQIRGKEVDKALDILKFSQKEISRALAKLVNSAVANAQNNFQIDAKDLFVKTITADDGPTLQRQTPRAHGRSTPIRKRTSHINLILGVKEGAKLKAASPKTVDQDEVKIVNPEDVKKDSSRGPDRFSGDGGKGGDGKGFMKGVFQRKTG